MPTAIRKASGDNKRQAILTAAVELFAEHGFHGTTVPSVAKRAGVGTGTIYRYFKSKEELGNTLYRKWKSMIAAMIIDRFPREQPVSAQFRWIWSQFARFTVAYPKAYAYLELNNHRSYLDEESRIVENRLIEFSTSWVTRAQDNQVLKPMPVRVLLAVLAGAFGGLMRACSEGRIAPDEQTLDTAAQCCWEAICS